MCSSGELQTATDDAAVKDSDDRHTAILNPVESAVPGPRTANAGRRADVDNGRKIGTGRKMLPLAVQDNGARLLRRIAEEGLDAGDRRIVQGISFGRARQNSVTGPCWLAVRLVGRSRLAWLSQFSRRTSLWDRRELICP